MNQKFAHPPLEQQPAQLTRRHFMQAMSALSASALTLPVAGGRKQYPIPARRFQITRKNAAALTAEEIERFKRAYQLIINNGTLDRLIAAHANMEQQQHEFVANVTLSTFHLMPYPSGERFLPWHRAFLLEMENALRNALTQSNGWAEGNRVFLPYWDVSHMTGMPAWASDWLPSGMTAISVAGLPPNHPGFSPAGTRYKVQLQRFPGTYPSSPTLPQKEHMSALLQIPDYQTFTRRLEWGPIIVRTPTSNELSQLRQLGLRVTDAQQNYALIAELLASGRITPNQQIDLMALIMRLESIRMDASYAPGANQNAARDLINATLQFYLLGPHNTVHAWAAGHNNLVKGTVLYQHENVADPLFWMLHCEVDRMWATWQTLYAGKPNLQGTDAIFQPLNPGQIWTLPELLNGNKLTYKYDQPYYA